MTNSEHRDSAWWLQISLFPTGEVTNLLPGVERPLPVRGEERGDEKEGRGKKRRERDGRNSHKQISGYSLGWNVVSK